MQKNKFLILFTLILVISCSKDYNTIGIDLLNSNTVNTNVEFYDVKVNQKRIPPFKSIGLPVYQLGQINDPIFGMRESSFITQLSLEQANPVFGILTQEKENDGDSTNILVIEEEETVKEVFLDIPFFNNTVDTDGDGVIDAYDVDPNDIYSDSDGDGLSDVLERANGTDPLNPDTDGDGILDSEDTSTINPNEGATIYDIDSLIGNKDASFKIKIQELEYFMSTYDPSNNFETLQKYFSDNSSIETFAGETIFDDEVSIDTNEIVTFREDDPDTDDIDESTLVKERLSPRLRIPLNKQYFQKKIIDKEGDVDLSNQDNFSLYFKGLIFNAYNFSEPLMLLLNYSEAELKIIYDYNKYNNNGTQDDISDDTIDIEEATFKVNLSGNQINIQKNQQFNAEILEAIDKESKDLDRVYIKGGEGLMLEIDLFQDNNGNNILNEIKAKGWLINEANLTLYIDKNQVHGGNSFIEPSRLYLFGINSKLPVIDYFIDNSQGQKQSDQKNVHGGLIEIDDDKKGVKYKIRISEHIKNIIKNDSTNIKLGLVVSSDINNSINTELKNNSEMEFIPISTVINPLGTVLYGPNPEPANSDKKLRLEIFYTEINN